MQFCTKHTDTNIPYIETQLDCTVKTFKQESIKTNNYNNLFQRKNISHLFSWDFHGAV